MCLVTRSNREVPLLPMPLAMVNPSISLPSGFQFGSVPRRLSDLDKRLSRPPQATGDHSQTLSAGVRGHHWTPQHFPPRTLMTPRHYFSIAPEVMRTHTEPLAAMRANGGAA